MTHRSEPSASEPSSRPDPPGAPAGAPALEALEATDALIAMQRTAGNRRVTRWMKRTGARAAVEGPPRPPPDPAGPEDSEEAPPRRP